MKCCGRSLGEIIFQMRRIGVFYHSLFTRILANWFSQHGLILCCGEMTFLNLLTCSTYFCSTVYLCLNSCQLIKLTKGLLLCLNQSHSDNTNKRVLYCLCCTLPASEVFEQLQYLKCNRVRYTFLMPQHLAIFCILYSVLLFLFWRCELCIFLNISVQNMPKFKIGILFYSFLLWRHNARIYFI